MTDTADYADYVLPATTQLEHLDLHTSYGHTYVMINEPAIAPLGEAKPNTEIFRELAARMGFDEPASPTSDETLARIAFQPSAAARLRRAARARLDQAADRRGAVRRGRLPPRRAATAGSTRPASACPTTCRTTSRAEQRPALAARFPLAMISPPARNFLNSTFVNVAEPARHRGRAGARDRTPPTPRRAASPTAQMVRVFNDRGEYRVPRRGQRARAAGRRQRPGRLVAQARRRTARNVNELTHQRLTDIGRAPSFYDCLVEVEPAADAGAVKRGWRMAASLGLGGLLATRCWPARRLPDVGLRDARLLRAIGRRGHLNLLQAARPVPRVARRPGDAAAAARRASSCPSASATSRSPSWARPTTPAIAAMPT